MRQRAIVLAIVSCMAATSASAAHKTPDSQGMLIVPVIITDPSSKDLRNMPQKSFGEEVFNEDSDSDDGLVLQHALLVHTLSPSDLNEISLNKT
jgi:hypothetical protein